MSSKFDQLLSDISFFEALNDAQLDARLLLIIGRLYLIHFLTTVSVDEASWLSGSAGRLDSTVQGSNTSFGNILFWHFKVKYLYLARRQGLN